MNKSDRDSSDDPPAGAIALVTGANSGIGQAVAEGLAAAGFKVGALDRASHAIPESCEPLEVDLQDAAAVFETIRGFGERHGRIDLLVNNAGVSFVGTIEDGDEEDWKRVFDINVFGQMRTLRAALPFLRQSEAASIILMSSCSALNGIPDRALYSASKGAIQGLGHALAADLVAENIRVNCISPGTVDTPFMQELIRKADEPESKRREYGNRQPTGTMIDPAEIARAVLYLADPRNRSVTGTTLEIDGGMRSIRRPAS